MSEVTLPYTASENCFMLIRATNTAGSASAGEFYSITSKLLGRVSGSCSYGMHDVRWIPVIKGDVVSLEHNTYDILNFFVIR